MRAGRDGLIFEKGGFRRKAKKRLAQLGISLGDKRLKPVVDQEERCPITGVPIDGMVE